MTSRLTTVGLDRFETLMSLYPRVVPRAASLAINDTARKTRTEAKRTMLDQVAWPASYLGNVRDGRLRVSRFAKPGDLSAQITGRWRATSLAQFATNAPSDGRNRRGRKIRVRVQPGSTSALDRAFFVRLRAGNTTTDSKFNLGLAVRVSPGETLRGSSAAVLLFENVYLLYGPSVNQVFRGVREDLAPGAAVRLNREFNRQIERLLPNG